MSIAIIGTVGLPACYGGFETLVENLVDEGGDYLVYCSSVAYSERRATYKGAKLKYLPINANGVSSIVYDTLSMLHAVFSKKKVLLILGVSACLLLPLLRCFTRRKLVTNIDGLEWKRDKWSRIAKWYLKISERAAVRFSHVVIADNKGIAEYIEREYGVIPQVIAYGGDHVLTQPIEKNDAGYAFSLCRIEPENNVHKILKSFKVSGKSLKFVGNWDSSEYGKNLKDKYSSCSNIEIIDPVYDINTLFKYRDNCCVYVHGHSAGGTNPSLVEAMFFSKPIIAFDCVYNRETLKGEGYYFSDSESLSKLFTESDRSEWTVCGEKILKVAEVEYKWTTIKNAYVALLR